MRRIGRCELTVEVGTIRDRHTPAARMPKSSFSSVPHRSACARRQGACSNKLYLRAHPVAPRIKTAAVNKWLNCLGAMLKWLRKKGLIPDEVPWSDSVAGMRLTETKSNHQPREPEALKPLFRSPVCMSGERPLGGKGLSRVLAAAPRTLQRRAAVRYLGMGKYVIGLRAAQLAAEEDLLTLQACWMVQLDGLEPPTSCSTNRRSNQLSYNCILREATKLLR